VSRPGPIPDRDPNRPKVPQVAEMIRDLYLSPGGSVGCCLHVVVDDFNIRSLDWTLAHIKDGHERCRRTAEALNAMTTSQRVRAIGRAHKMLSRAGFYGACAAGKHHH
jgi:hypothetical protein